MAPIVQEKLLGTEAVRVMFGLPPEQIAAAGAFVTAGVGFTVTVIVYGVAAAQFPAVDVGVTIYSTVPAVVLLGLVSVWLIRLPAPAVAPVIPPVTVPMVHVNVLAVLAVSVIFGLVALQICTEAGLVTAGVGLTVTVIV